jgi:hypothetical protein
MVRAKSKCGAATRACGRASADKAGGMSSAWSGLLGTDTVCATSADCNNSISAGTGQAASSSCSTTNFAIAAQDRPAPQVVLVGFGAQLRERFGNHGHATV